MALKKVSATWEYHDIEFVFGCPYCGEWIDDTAVDDAKIVPGRHFNGKTKCPKCKKAFYLTVGD